MFNRAILMFVVLFVGILLFSCGPNHTGGSLSVQKGDTLKIIKSGNHYMAYVPVITNSGRTTFRLWTILNRVDTLPAPHSLSLTSANRVDTPAGANSRIYKPLNRVDTPAVSFYIIQQDCTKAQ